jgi:hypothetical protein
MRLFIDQSQVLEHIGKLETLPEQTKVHLWRRLRESNQVSIRHIKANMPVDIGRARASWGQWTPQDLRPANAQDARGRRQLAAAGPYDTHHAENRAELWIEQGSNLPYVHLLNAGWSKQHAGGFVDEGAAFAAMVMKKGADEIKPKL